MIDRKNSIQEMSKIEKRGSTQDLSVFSASKDRLTSCKSLTLKLSTCTNSAEICAESLKSSQKSYKSCNSYKYKMPSLSDLDPNTYDYSCVYKKSASSKQPESRLLEKPDMKKHRELNRKHSHNFQEFSFQPNPEKCKRRSRRSHDQVYSDIMKREKIRKSRLEQLKKTQESDSQEQENFDFKPKIGAKSSKIFKKSNYQAEKCHDRLFNVYKRSSNREETISKFFNFTPNTDSFMPNLNNTSSQDIHRKPIVDRLYEDAVRRQSNEPVRSDSTQTSSLNNSKRILVSSLMRELDSHCSEVTINYTSFLELLKSMSFLSFNPSSEELSAVVLLWNTAAKDKATISKAQVKQLLKISVGDYGSSPRQHKHFQALHNKTRILYKNRLSVNKQFRNQERRNKSGDTFELHRESSNDTFVSSVSRQKHGKHQSLFLNQVQKDIDSSGIHMDFCNLLSSQPQIYSNKSIMDTQEFNTSILK